MLASPDSLQIVVSLYESRMCPRLSAGHDFRFYPDGVTADSYVESAAFSRLVFFLHMFLDQSQVTIKDGIIAQRCRLQLYRGSDRCHAVTVHFSENLL